MDEINRNETDSKNLQCKFQKSIYINFIGNIIKY